MSWFLNGPPLPHWDLPSTILIAFLRAFLKTLTQQYSVLHLRVTSVPFVPQQCRVEHLRIPRRSFSTDGIDDTVSDDEEIDGEWVTCQGELLASRVVLMIHGGAFVAGSAADHRQVSGTLGKDLQCKVLAINYRLAPEHPYPCALHDCLSAYFYLIQTLNFHPRDVFLYGTSAGAQLTIAMSLWLRDHSCPLPAGAIAVSPGLDFTGSTPSRYLHGDYDFVPLTWTSPAFQKQGKHSFYLNTNAHLVYSPYVSPVYAEATASPLCPILLQTGGAERYRDDALVFFHRMRRTAADKGISVPEITCQVYESCVHVWPQIQPYSLPAKVARAQVVEFVDGCQSEFESKREEKKVLLVRGGCVEVVEDVKSVLLKGYERLYGDPTLYRGSPFEWENATKLLGL